MFFSTPSFGQRVLNTMSEHPVATLAVGVGVGVAGTLAAQQWVMPMFEQSAVPTANAGNQTLTQGTPAANPVNPQNP